MVIFILCVFSTIKTKMSQMKMYSFQANFDPDHLDSVYFLAFTYHHIPQGGDQSCWLHPEILYQLLVKSMPGKQSTL